MGDSGHCGWRETRYVGFQNHCVSVSHWFVLAVLCCCLQRSKLCLSDVFLGGIEKLSGVLLMLAVSGLWKPNDTTSIVYVAELTVAVQHVVVGMSHCCLQYPRFLQCSLWWWECHTAACSIPGFCSAACGGGNVTLLPAASQVSAVQPVVVGMLPLWDSLGPSKH